MPRNILIADDNTDMLRMYSRILSEKDYSLTLAESVKDAARLIESNDYDLLITDLMFPDGQGTELTKLFSKKSGGTSLLISGSLPPGCREELPGVFECMAKPLHIDKFLESVEKAIG